MFRQQRKWIGVADVDVDNYEKMIDDDLEMIGLAFPFRKIVVVALLPYFQIGEMKMFEEIPKPPLTCLNRKMFPLLGFLVPS